MSEKNPKNQNWSNPSVLKLAGDSDPIEVIASKVRDLIYQAFEQGWEQRVRHIGIIAVVRTMIPSVTETSGDLVGKTRINKCASDCFCVLF